MRLERFKRPKVVAGLAFAALVGTVILVVSVILFRAAAYTPDVIFLAQEYQGTGITTADLPPAWLNALIAVEDPAFFEHAGVDFHTKGAGWTTITQGLVKLNYPGPMRGPYGKARQSLIALALNHALDKELQLTLFLNTAYLGQVDGRPVRGFQEAAEQYYGLDFEELTLDQFLSLVAMLPAPGKLDPIDNAVANRERVRRIHALLAGRCSPAGWRDVYLNGCAGSDAQPLADSFPGAGE